MKRVEWVLLIGVFFFVQSQAFAEDRITPADKQMWELLARAIRNEAAAAASTCRIRVSGFNSANPRGRQWVRLSEFWIRTDAPYFSMDVSNITHALIEYEPYACKGYYEMPWKNGRFMQSSVDGSLRYEMYHVLDALGADCNPSCNGKIWFQRSSTPSR